MRILLLGTGSADGWPNPFCACASCAHQRSSGIVRGPSSALVDDTILIDPGPGVPTAAGRAGVDLRGVRHVLVTHGHPDHCAPSLLLWRHWVPQDAALTIWAPSHALALFEDWVGPASDVTLRAVAPGDTLDLDPHVVDVVSAAHAHGDGDVLAAEAVLYRVTSPDAVMLYATDTGPLPEATLQQLAHSRADVVLLDATFGNTTDHGTGHLDFATLPEAVAALRDHGIVDASAQVIATHLSHHNPPEPKLRETLAAIGLRPGSDGEVIDTARLNGHVVLVTGGARSGKSSFAETRARALEAAGASVVYLATAPLYPDDAEWQRRLEAHRTRRPAAWRTIEGADIPGIVRAADRDEVILVDCLGMWLTRFLDESALWGSAAATKAVDAALDEIIDALQATAAVVVIVTNEVGTGVVPETASGRLFRDLLGVANARIAAVADEAVMLVAGRPLPLGGAPRPTTLPAEQRP